MSEKLLLKSEEAAEALSLSVRTIRYLTASGELAPIVRIGRSVRIPASTLRAFVEKRTTEAETSVVQMEPSLGRSTRLRTG